MTNKGKAIKLCCNTCTARKCCNKTLSDSCDDYKHVMKMAKWKDKQLIEKAAERLEENASSYMSRAIGKWVDMLLRNMI